MLELNHMFDSGLCLLHVLRVWQQYMRTEQSISMKLHKYNILSFIFTKKQLVVFCHLTIKSVLRSDVSLFVNFSHKSYCDLTTSSTLSHVSSKHLKK